MAGSCTAGGPRRRRSINLKKSVAATALIAAPDAVSWWSANLWDSFAHWCVPVFVMLSGALLLGRREPAPHFWRKRAARLVWPLVGWRSL